MLLNQLCRSDDVFKTVLWDLTTRKHTLPANVAHELARSSKLRGNRESVVAASGAEMDTGRYCKLQQMHLWQHLKVAFCYLVLQSVDTRKSFEASQCDENKHLGRWPNESVLAWSQEVGLGQSGIPSLFTKRLPRKVESCGAQGETNFWVVLFVLAAAFEFNRC